MKSKGAESDLFIKSNPWFIPVSVSFILAFNYNFNRYKYGLENQGEEEMINLITASAKAYDIAKRRGIKETTFEALKHCAGEILEANEAYNNWTFCETSDSLKELFEDELADIIMCCLSICGAEGINIEKALDRVFLKNEKRAGKNDSKK